MKTNPPHVTGLPQLAVLPRMTLLIGLLTSLAGCASIITDLPDISTTQLEQERETQVALAQSNIEALQNRLHRIAAPILLENAALCTNVRQDIGVITHKLSDYSKALKNTSAGALGATKDPSVVWVNPNNTSGFKRGDILLDKDGEALGIYSKDFKTYMASEPNTIIVRRGDIAIPLPVTPQAVCGYKVNLSVSNTINAYADGRNITVTSGMMKFVNSDEELAMVVGHELGHNTMGHIKKIVKNLLLSGFATRYTRPFESEADYVGLYYMVRAGYDPENVEDVWRRLGASNPRSLDRAKTHPATPDRYLRISAARKEIEQKQKTGALLLPNFLTKAQRKAQKKSKS